MLVCNFHIFIIIFGVLFEEVHCACTNCSLSAYCDNVKNECLCNPGYYGNGTVCEAGFDITCKDNEMSITVINEVFQNVDFTLRDTSCILQKNSTHSSYTTSYDQCMTTSSQDGSYLFYRNYIKSYFDPSALIIRDPIHEISFACKFIRRINGSLHVAMLWSVGQLSTGGNETNIPRINVKEGSLGAFSLSLDLIAASMLKASALKPDMKTDKPLEIKTRDELIINFTVNAENNVKLIPQQCFATPTSNVNDHLKHYLIQDRCGIDSTYIQNALSPFSFSFQAFQFTNKTYVSFHCYLLLCTLESEAEECSFGCEEKRRRRKRNIDTGDVSSIYTISSRRVMFIEDDDDDLRDVENEKNIENKVKKTFNSNTLLTLLLSIVFVFIVLIIILMVVLWLYLRRKRSACGSSSSQKERLYKTHV